MRAGMQYLTAAAFLWALHTHGASGHGVRLVWAGLPRLSDLLPFLDVGWKLLTRTLFKMAAFASISSVATTLPHMAVASHQVRFCMSSFAQASEMSRALRPQLQGARNHAVDCSHGRGRQHVIFRTDAAENGGREPPGTLVRLLLQPYGNQLRAASDPGGECFAEASPRSCTAATL